MPFISDPDHHMQSSPESFPRPKALLWMPQRLVRFAVCLILLSFVLVFWLDGAQLSTALMINAVANCVAVVVTAWPIWKFCQLVKWRDGNRWWFLPVHVVAAGGAILLWYVSIGVILGVTGLLQGLPWLPVWLTGPARNWQMVTALYLYFAIAAGSYLMQTARDAQLAVSLRHDAEMFALRAQLDPHLLFNTLHSLLELVRSGDARADHAIERFARLTRYVSAARAPDRDMVPLADEWRMVEDYFALESLRLGTRLAYTLSCDADAQQELIPALTLQPLVENAIVHGVAPFASNGRVHVRAQRTVRGLEFAVEDSGGASEAADRTPDSAIPVAGSRRGLALVQKRLTMRYGPALHFYAGPREHQPGWVVRFVLPVTAT